MGKQHTLPEGVQGGLHPGGGVLKDDGELGTRGKWNSIQEEGAECLKALKCGKACHIPGADEESGVVGLQDACMAAGDRVPRETSTRE